MKLDERLRKLVEKIKDRSLREKVMELLENPTIEIEGKKFSGLPLESSQPGFLGITLIPADSLSMFWLRLK